MPLQLRVPRGRPSPPGAGQAGEDRLPPAVHDGRGPDAGVVPPPGDGIVGGIGVGEEKRPFGRLVDAASLART